MDKKLRVTLVRSPIGYSIRQKRTVKALGLRKLNQVVELPDRESVRGMVKKIPHLVQVEEIEN
jgi:large subunit ribosomal protein L30